MHQRYSLHKIVEKEQYPFNPSDYSRFKFGDTSRAKKFAEELFRGFIDHTADALLEQPEIIVLPSPYHAIPTASNFLCAFFKRNLDRFLFENNRAASKEGKIHRKQTYIDDYGNMDYEQRLRLISNDTYYIDKQFIEGKFCIFLDDIKITGSHEHTVNKILEQYSISGEFFFVYYAELVNKNIHPNIENHYNYFAIKSIKDIVKILNNHHFRFNTRIVKYMLLTPGNEFDFLLEQISLKQQEELLRSAISNNYHQITNYQNNIQKLNHHLWQSIYKKDKENVSRHHSSLLV
ncbi:phosphoribosyltransferase family protein [Niabella sp. 22666]|uniref:phosphoribosyltransferase family protein n=1 Tax=Niabella sp. 22666 TaxID=3453954 RepID=UPI003F82E0D0